MQDKRDLPIWTGLQTVKRTEDKPRGVLEGGRWVTTIRSFVSNSRAYVQVPRARPTSFFSPGSAFWNNPRFQTSSSQTILSTESLKLILGKLYFYIKIYFVKSKLITLTYHKALSYCYCNCLFLSVIGCNIFPNFLQPPRKRNLHIAHCPVCLTAQHRPVGKWTSSPQ